MSMTILKLRFMVLVVKWIWRSAPTDTEIAKEADYLLEELETALRDEIGYAKE